ncbi:MAG: hypothetical protein IQL11_14865 [Bacteroidales bacterium]|nr:hypothetical protein [Bacteroidales bacterium]
MYQGLYKAEYLLKKNLVNAFVLYALQKTFIEDVIDGPTLPVHADLYFFA